MPILENYLALPSMVSMFIQVDGAGAMTKHTHATINALLEPIRSCLPTIIAGPTIAATALAVESATSAVIWVLSNPSASVATAGDNVCLCIVSALKTQNENKYNLCLCSLVQSSAAVFLLYYY